MKYYSHRLVRLYLYELAAKMRRGLSYTFTAVRYLLFRGVCALATWWAGSLQYRYLRYRCMDFTRVFKLTPRHTWVHMGLCLCSLTGLGFISTSSPADETPSYYLRINVNRPQVTTLRADQKRAILNQEDLHILRKAGLTPENSAWFAAGKLEQLPQEKNQVSPSSSTPDWFSSGGFLALSAGRVTLRTASGERVIPAMGQITLHDGFTLLPAENMSGVATGILSPDSLLAELDPRLGRAFAERSRNLAAHAPEWGGGMYGATVFSEPNLYWNGAQAMRKMPGVSENICRLDRMETASWLALLRLENTSGASSREPLQYREYVEHFSGRYSLSPSLVYAIMRVESSFNPIAVSPANALGLMQVVPQTAGGEVHAYLTGKNGIPRPELLFAPESNIQYGTTYLHLLRDRHFKDIKNPLSREICIVAAYNCGPGPVYRVFSRDRDRALQQINSLAPEQLYDRLVTDLPSPETREYLPKVLGARNDFVRGAVNF